MKTKKRPFFKLSIYQIEKIVKDRNAADDNSDIIYELSFRKTQRAKVLMKNISHQITKTPIEKSKPTNQKSSDNLFMLSMLGFLLLINVALLSWIFLF